MNISVCIDALYQNKDFFKGLEEIKNIGVCAFEFWTWWDKDISKVKEYKDKLNLQVSAFCTKFISLTNPDQKESYIAGLIESIQAAKYLDCKTLISQIGNDTGVCRERQLDSIVCGLRECVPLLTEAGITLVIEPLNDKIDHRGTFLIKSKEGFEIIDSINSSKVKLLYDIYHQQISEGDIIRTISQNIINIGHFHAAGNPGRHELHLGEINYPAVFKEIDRTGYDGYIGFEYFPIEEPKCGIKLFV